MFEKACTQTMLDGKEKEITLVLFVGLFKNLVEMNVEQYSMRLFKNHVTVFWKTDNKNSSDCM